MFKQFMD